MSLLYCYSCLYATKYTISQSSVQKCSFERLRLSYKVYAPLNMELTGYLTEDFCTNLALCVPTRVNIFKFCHKCLSVKGFFALKGDTGTFGVIFLC